ncbi:hypothetical protein BB560_001748 [Smittium megazygosporum]|uniref:Uncharacterized protein n=1 Tax=Smittium megazygosporum TaxID=133381 RepID=A0A2T9ZGN5_9FUNG|nr:hypothetical protein BB560_001748 [Smittium megazygosporum]
MSSNTFGFSQTSDFLKTVSSTKSSYFPAGFSAFTSTVDSVLDSNLDLQNDSDFEASGPLDQELPVPGTINAEFSTSLQSQSGLPVSIDNTALLTIQGQGVQLLDSSSSKVIREWNFPEKPEFCSKAILAPWAEDLNNSNDQKNSGDSDKSKNECQFVYAAVNSASTLPKDQEGRMIWRWPIANESSGTLPKVSKLPEKLATVAVAPIFQIYPVKFKNSGLVIAVYKNAYISIFNSTLQEYVFGSNIGKKIEYLKSNIDVLSCHIIETNPTTLSLSGLTEEEYRLAKLDQHKKTSIVLVTKTIPSDTNSTNEKLNEFILISVDVTFSRKKVVLTNLVTLPKLEASSLIDARVNFNSKNIELLLDTGKLLYGSIERDHFFKTSVTQEYVHFRAKDLNEVDFSSFLGFNHSSSDNTVSKADTKAKNDAQNTPLAKNMSFISLQNDLLIVSGIKLDEQGILSHTLVLFNTKFNTVINSLSIPDNYLNAAFTDKKATGDFQFYSSIVLLDKKDISSTESPSSSSNTFDLQILQSVGVRSTIKSTTWNTSTCSVVLETRPVNLLSLIKLSANTNLSINERNNLESINSKPSELFFHRKSKSKSSEAFHYQLARDLEHIMSYNTSRYTNEGTLLKRYYDDHIVAGKKTVIEDITRYLNNGGPSPLFLDTLIKLVTYSLGSTVSFEYLKTLIRQDMISYYSASTEIPMIKRLTAMLFDGQRIRKKVLSIVTLLIDHSKDIPASDLIYTLATISKNFKNKEAVIHQFYLTPRSKNDAKDQKLDDKAEDTQLEENDIINLSIFKKVFSKVISRMNNQSGLGESLYALSNFALSLLLHTLESWMHERLCKVFPIDIDESLRLYSRKYGKLDSTKSIDEILEFESSYLATSVVTGKVKKSEYQIPNEERMFNWISKILDYKMTTILSAKRFSIPELRLRLQDTLQIGTESITFVSENIYPWLLPFHIQAQAEKHNPSTKDRKAGTTKAKPTNSSGAVKNTMLGAATSNTSNDYIIETINW